MPIPLDHLRPITVENAAEVIELGWFRQYIEIGGTGSIYAVALSNDGQLLASGGNAGIVAIWDVQTGERRAFLDHNFRTITALGFSPDGELLAVSSFPPPPTITVWNIATRTQTLSAETTGFPANIAFSADAELITTFDFDDNSIQTLDAETGEIITNSETTAISPVAFVKNNRLIVMAYDTTIQFFDSQSSIIMSTIKTEGIVVSDIVTNSDRTLLAIGELTRNADDTYLYGAPNCAVRASQRTNLRTRSGVDNPIGGALQQRDLGFVVGQQEDVAGFTWWKLSNDLWVRSDIVEVASGCHDVPVISD